MSSYMSCPPGPVRVMPCSHHSSISCSAVRQLEMWMDSSYSDNTIYLLGGSDSERLGYPYSLHIPYIFIPYIFLTYSLPIPYIFPTYSIHIPSMMGGQGAMNRVSQPSDRYMTSHRLDFFNEGLHHFGFFFWFGFGE